MWQSVLSQIVAGLVFITSLVAGGGSIVWAALGIATGLLILSLPAHFGQLEAVEGGK